MMNDSRKKSGAGGSKNKSSGSSGTSSKSSSPNSKSKPSTPQSHLQTQSPPGNKPKNPHRPSPASANPTPPSLSPEPRTTGTATTGRGDIILSQNKVRAIMKSSPEVEHVGNDALYLITKATELFVHHMGRNIHQAGKGSKSIEYKQLSEVVRQENNLEFLKDIIPNKIPARLALQEIAKRKSQENKFLMD